MGPRWGVAEIANGQMEYIRFGRGSRVLVMLPGLGDSLRSLKGTALPVALLYRCFARDFTVYVFSRRQPLSRDCSTREMARDQAEAMEALGIKRADVFGVSMGGMIAQHFAADYPQMVNKLVLAVTSSCPTPVLRESVEEWKACALAGDHTAFMDSNLRRIYSQAYCRKNLWAVPLLGKLTKPKSYERFFIQADACLHHDACGRLGGIHARTLVVGGEQDKVLGGDASREIARRIPDAALFMYPQWGHGLYEEAKDFNRRVLGFLLADPETAFGGVSLAGEEKLGRVDWSVRDVLVGAVRSPQQLRFNIENTCYYVPARHLPQDRLAVGFIALHEEDLGEEPAIRRFGQVADIQKVKRGSIPVPMRPGADPQEEYWYFTLNGWKELPRPIRIRDTFRGKPRFTSRFLLEHCTCSYQLFVISNEEDYRLMVELGRGLETLFSAPSGGIRYPIREGFHLRLTQNDLTVLRDSGEVCEKLTLSSLGKHPCAGFIKIRKALEQRQGFRQAPEE